MNDVSSSIAVDSFWLWFDTIKEALGQRQVTFTRMFEYLDALKRPVTIVETGCARHLHDTEEKNWRGDGQSTILFDRYVSARGGKVFSVDIDFDHVAFARSRVSERVRIFHGDSVEHLRTLVRKDFSPDLVYLDSLDFMEQDPFRTALHCANEFFAIRPVLRADSLVVCDDTPSTFVSGLIPRVELFGKGAFVGYHAQAVGADMLFNNWQTGWTHMTGSADSTNELDVDQLIGRARKHFEANQAANAERCYRAVIHKTRPPKSGVDRVARGEACAFYARTAAATGQYGTAADWYRDAIMSDPRAVDYRLELVTRSYRPQLNWQLAEQECLRSIEIEPDNANAWRILGDVMMSMCNVKDAIWAYDKEMELLPGDPHAMLDRCVIALDVADYDLVRKLANEVLKTDRRADGLHVMAMIANRTGEHARAIELFDEAIAAGCNNQATAHWNKSLSLHALGRYKEGWTEHEWRQKETNNPALSISFQRFTRPLWEGQPPPAKIHVHAEAGLGDNILYSRFLNLLLERGYNVRYETHHELVELMKRSFPQVEIVPRAPDYPGAVGIANFDYHLPLGSMTHALGTDIDTVPWPGPYLKPDPAKVAQYERMLPKGKKIGVCWSSGIREYAIWLMEYGKRKSMHFDTMRPIMDKILEQASVVSLQLGPERKQIAKAYPIIDLLPEKPDCDETAALIANLDLVVTVDTAVAHLAGALGKPVWIMMQRDGASFHFMAWNEGSLWNEKSPWYPTVRLFRQHRFNEPHYWDEVVSDIVTALGECNVRRADPTEFDISRRGVGQSVSKLLRSSN